MSLAPAHRTRTAVEPLTLGVAFAAAVVIRIAMAGPARAASMSAGLVFAGLLVLLVAGRRPHTRVSPGVLAIGLAGAAALVVPALLAHGLADQQPGGSYLRWSAAVVAVAGAEEAFLRGALFDALNRWRGRDVAVVGAAVAFALLHVPLYGWRAVPVDFAVGLVLGALRLLTGTWVAPAVAHIGADLAGWWFV